MASSNFAPRRTTASALVLVLASGLLSCAESATSGESGVARIDATPSTLTLLVDETKGLSARAFDAAGTPLSRPLFWSVSDASIITVTQGGIVTGISRGSAQVAASAGGKSVLVPVIVAPRAVALVRVTPATTTIRVGATTPLAVQILDSTGVTLTGRTVQWTTSAATVATVNGTGVVSGIAAGSATITATVDGVRGTAAVSVQPVPVATVVVSPTTAALLDGASVTLNAVTRDSAGRTLTGRTVAWTSSATAVASVSSTGVVLAVAPGTATITATSEGKTATSRVTITPVPVRTVTVSPATSTLSVGQTVPLVARVADSTGAPLNGRVVSWTTDRAAVATVNATTGLVTAVATGTARITATSEGRTGASVITVATIPVASVQVTPASASLLPGQAQRLTARTLDAQGRVLTGRPVKWIGGAPAIAPVDSTGLVRAVGVGTAVIVASSEGALTSVPITVLPITVTKVTVTPATASVELGNALQLSASITDALGRPVAGKVATWSTNNPALATVSPTGRVQTIANYGTVTISATSDGVTGVAALAITPIRVSRITLTPSAPALLVAQSLRLGLQLTDSLGRPVATTGRTIVWASSAPAVATVDTSGLVTALSAGTADISASTDGKTGIARLVVSDVPVSSVTLSPLNAQFIDGSSLQLSATAIDGSGNPIPRRTAAWSSSATAFATVDSTGKVFGVAPGAATITATIGGVPGSTMVTISAAPVSSITVAPAAVTLAPGGTQSLSATLYGPTPNVPISPAPRTIAWSISAGNVATISPSGVVTGLAAGTATVTVTAWSPGQAVPVTARVIVTVQ